MKKIILCLSVSLAGLWSGATAQNISTFAGGYILTNCPATDAALNPVGIALDNSGNIYVSDIVHFSIRKISTAGTITTIAGNGTQGYSGDGGAASAAALSGSNGVAVDGTGNIYITDENRIRKINTAGIISTIAGSSSWGYSGDGGPATAATLNYPQSVSTDAAGNVYISDTYNHRIRKIDTAGTITTFAGDGSHGYSGDGGPANATSLYYPHCATVVGGNVYIADWLNNRIRMVNAAGIISTFAGNGRGGFSGDGGPATAAGLNYPIGVTADGIGNIFVSDIGNYLIRKIDTAGTITTIAGDGTYGYNGDGVPATVAALASTINLVVDSWGNAYLADNGNSRIRRVDTTGVISTIAGNGTAGYTGDGGPATGAELYYPYGVATDDSDNVYIADTYNYRIRKVVPAGVAVDGNGNLFIADYYNHAVRKVTVAGTISTIAGNGTRGYSGDGGAATAAELAYPIGVAVDSSGEVYIADMYNHRIRRVSATGVISTIAGNGSWGFSGDGGPATAANFNSPYGIALDNSGNIYITDAGNNRIRKINPAGIISTIAGDGSGGYSGDGGPATAAALTFPAGIDVAGGNIYISDYNNQRIRKIDALGIISTVAGNGTRGYSGDGGPATAAEIAYPIGVALDGTGNLYIADASNGRIRKVDPSGLAIGGPYSVCSGATVTLSGTVAGGIWTSSNTSVATAGSATGIVSGLSVGTTTITYTTGTATATRVVTVNPLPSSITGVGSLCAGSTMTLSDAITGGTWTSSNARATIGSADGIVNGVTAGTAIITYGFGGTCRAIRAVTVNPYAPITGSSTVCEGLTTVLASAAAGGTWSSSSTSVATIGSTRRVTGVLAGTATISYRLPGGCLALKTMTVNPSPAVITGLTSVCAGSSLTLSNGVSGGAWTSGNPARGSIDAGTGVLTGRAAGNMGVSYTLSGGCKATYIVTVNAFAPITGVGTVCEGLTTILANAAAGGTWSSSNTAVATIGTARIVSGMSAGMAVISYDIPGGCRALKTVTVNQSPTVITGAGSVCVGSAVTLSNGVSGGAWTSSSPARGSIDVFTGRVTGRSAGTTNISYTLSNGCRATYTETVNAWAAITGTASVCEGLTTVLANPIAGGTWSNSNTAVATIGSAGMVSSVTTGMTTITYSIPGGCQVLKTVTVNQSPTAIAGASTVAVGAIITLSDGVAGGVWTSSNVTRGSVDVGTGVVRGRASGSTVIAYTLAGNCRTTTTISVTAHKDAPAVPAETFACGDALSIFPNPTAGDFVINGSIGTTEEQSVAILITDVAGKTVYSSSIVVTDGTINQQVSLANITSGTYLLHINWGAGNNVFRLVIRK
jgi:sugar lactone lactonase YvrE